MRKFITDILAKANLGVEQNAYVLGTVGIGTSTPAAMLTLNGTTPFIRIERSGVNTWQIQNNYLSTTNGFSINNISTGATPFFISEAGNVGIGTTSPGATYSEKLQVLGSSLGRINVTHTATSDPRQSDILFTEGATLQFQIGTVLGNGTFPDQNWVRGTGDLPVTIHTNSIERFRVTPGGGVGIGTANPGQTLTVIGTAAAYSAIGDSDNVRTGLAHYDTTAQAVGVGGQLVLGYKYTDAGDYTEGAIIKMYKENGTSGAFGSGLKFQVRNNGANLSTKMVLNPSGNVGIGTTSPANLLHLYGTDGNSYLRWTSDVATTGTRIGYNGTEFRIDQQQNADVTIRTNGSERMRITSSGNVGIGTTNTDPLSLARERNLAIVTTGTNATLTLVGGGAGRIDFGVGSTRTAGIYSDVSNYTEIFTSTALPLVLSTNSVERMRITSGGNIGIGTTSPTDKLQVVASTYNGITITTPDVATFKMRSTSGTTSWGFATTNLAANDFGIYQSNSGGGDPINAGTARLYFNGSGNVGIGTTSPSAKLDVNGAQIIQSAAGFGTDGDQAALFLSNTANFGLSGSFSGYSRNLIKSDGGSILTVGRWNTSLIGELSIESGSSGLIKFLAGASERMRITSGGNVGIGTTSPSEILHVKSPGGNGGIWYPVFLGQNSTGYQNAFQARVRDEITDLGATILGANTGSELSFSNHPNGGGLTERMRITKTGNVGIGITNPDTKLDVGFDANNRSIVRLNSNAANRMAGVTFYGNNVESSTIGYEGGSEIVSGGVQGDLVIRNHLTSKNIVLITNGGNVGIGTTSPATKLEVRGTVTFFGDSSFQAGNLVLVDVASGGSTWGIYSGYPSLGDFTIRESGIDNRFVIKKTTGNVGIGTTSPGEKLTVNGAIGYQYSGTQTWHTYANSANSWELVRSGIATRMLVTSDGNVGIGTTSPNARLTVVANDSSNPNVALRLSSTAYSGVSYPYTSIRFGSAYSSYPSWNLASIDAGYTGASWGGSLLFYTNNDSGETNLTERMRITSAGNVGIGTTSPGTLLHLVQSSGPTIRLVRTSNRFDITADNDFMELNARDASTYMIFRTADTERMRITSAGNVGIGTTSPSEKLEVDGNVQIGSSVDAKLYMVSSGGNGYNERFFIEGYADGGTYGGGFKLSTRDDSNVFNTAVTVNRNGNVGIGTTSPSAPLHVYKSDTYSAIISRADWNIAPTRLALGAQYGVLGYISTGLVETTNDTTYIALNYKNGLSTYAEGLRVYNNGNVGIGTTSPNAKLTVLAASTGYSSDSQIKISDSTTSYYGGFSFDDAGATRLSIRNSYDGTGSIIGFGFGSSADKVQIIDGTGLIVNEGNVGIGTTSPTLGLHIADGKGLLVGPSGASGSMYVSPSDENTINGSYGIASDTADIWLNYRGYQDGFSYFRDTRIGNGKGTAILMVDGSEGNVGIGTTSPATKFHVVGSRILVEDTNAGIMFRTGGVDRYSVASNGGAFQIYDEVNLTNRLYITSTGNVGIGTTSPNAKLEVVGNINTRGLYFYDGGNSGTLRIDNSYGGGIDYHADQNGHRFFTWVSGTGWVQHFTITDAGNVGIGTTSPAYKLDVATGNDNAIRILNSSGSNNNGLALSVGSGTPWLDFYGGRFDIKYNTSPGSWNSGANTFLSILSSGNVGIGTTSPSYNLHVEGNTSGISIYASHDIAAFSDITVKKEVKKIENAIEKVKELNGYTYVRTDDKTGTRRAGVIAQEVQKVLPEVVSANPDGTLNVAYSNMIALLIEGMKEQQATIERLENRIKMLEK